LWGKNTDCAQRLHKHAVGSKRLVGGKKSDKQLFSYQIRAVKVGYGQVKGRDCVLGLGSS